MNDVGVLCFGVGCGLLMYDPTHSPLIEAAIFLAAGLVLVLGSWLWRRRDAKRPAPPPSYVDKVPR